MIGPSEVDWGERALRSAVHRDLRGLEEALTHDPSSVHYWNAKEEIWPTPLLASAYIGHLEAVMLLLARGANPLVRTTAKFTVLHYLASYCDAPFEELYPVMNMLIEKGAVLHATTDQLKLTPLQAAAYYKKPAALQVLLQLEEDAVKAAEALQMRKKKKEKKEHRNKESGATETNSSAPMLPIDVLGLIFAYFPLRRRLSVFSFVCKHWRNAALRSLKRLSLSGDRGKRIDVVTLLYCFASVTQLDLAWFSTEIVVPPTVRRLSLFTVIKIAPPCPPLTHFHAVLTSSADLYTPLILSASSQTLCSLSLSFQTIDESIAGFLSSLTFPCLTSLAFTNFARPALPVFLAAHRSQIRSMSLSGTGYTTLGVFHGCPHLTDLELDLSHLTSDMLTEMLKSYPRLSTLKVAHTRDSLIPFSSPELAATLVEVRGVVFSDLTTYGAKFDSLPRLDSIWPTDRRVSRADFSLTFSTRVAVLDFEPEFAPNRVATVLQRCTNLVELTLRHPCDSLPPLPRLTRLVFNGCQQQLPQIESTVRLFVGKCCRLHTLRIIADKKDLALLRGLVEESKRAGVEIVHLLER